MLDACHTSFLNGCCPPRSRAGVLRIFFLACRAAWSLRFLSPDFWPMDMDPHSRAQTKHADAGGNFLGTGASASLILRRAQPEFRPCCFLPQFPVLLCTMFKRMRIILFFAPGLTVSFRVGRAMRRARSAVSSPAARTRSLYHIMRLTVWHCAAMVLTQRLAERRRHPCALLSFTHASGCSGIRAASMKLWVCGLGDWCSVTCAGGFALVASMVLLYSLCGGCDSIAARMSMI